ncbi:hypothetical protein AOQ84DRAFT_36505 [Glonium stellatum]|uniref:Uncharacterized protein n=1 Tax=Glonium stellatum TaxID=574774 RepID=A0A8E2JT39_9PEZI|nr:hypothetical protein AOQ84DRAFT_36505 [Glonium stellatum]
MHSLNSGNILRVKSLQAMQMYTDILMVTSESTFSFILHWGGLLNHRPRYTPKRPDSNT